MLYITGDCHGDFSKLSNKYFSEQRSLTKEDIVIICGDFGGIWGSASTKFEEYWLKWLDNRNFTTVFIDGNHENFQRLNNDFEVVQFYGGRAHKISNTVFHLIRGEVYNIQSKKIFTFGGAQSHDIQDGILCREDFRTEYLFKEAIRKYRHQRKAFRIKDISWWSEELPAEVEINNANKNLVLNNYEVDYIITHCAPYDIAKQLRFDDNNILTQYFNTLVNQLKFKHWYFGHYHEDIDIGNFSLLYKRIIRLG